MSVQFTDAALWSAAWILIKASMLLGIAALAHRATRRRTSAAARHLAWTGVVMVLLLLPILSAGLPSWALPVAVTPASTARVDHPPAKASLAAPPDASDRSSSVASLPPVDETAARSRPMSWSLTLLAVYLAGVTLLFVRLAADRLTIARIARRAVAVDDPHWRRLLLECARTLGVDRPVRLLRSRDRTMPMAFGTRRPVILLPAIADTWSDDRCRAVLLHELAHTGRRDCLTQQLAAAACAVYWIHPGVWWVARRLRIERELACDDLVLAAGTQARAYAGHLLELAHSLGGGRAPALVVSMARPRQLEGRLLAVMDTARNRAVPALRSRVAGVAIAIAAAVPLASIHAVVVDARASSELALPAPIESGDLAVATPGPMMAPVARIGAAAQAARPAAPTPARQRGTWEIRSNADTSTVHLRLTEGDSSSGSTVPLTQLEGLTAAQLAGAGGAVRFGIRRDGGTFTFEGTARDGVGAGTYAFAPNQAFAGELEKRAVGRPTADEQYQLALHDIGFAFLDELTAQRYAKPSIAELVRAGQHGARLTYLHEMGEAGYHLGSLEPLITLRDHGVTPDYVRALAAQGFKGLSAEELRRTRDHGVSAEFVRELRDLGYGSLTLEQIVNARDHGLSTEFVKDLVALGHSKVPLDELIRLRDHGVSSSYVKEMRELGLTLDLDQLVKARDHGVTTDYVRELSGLGYRDQSIDSLIRLRDHGVTSGYVRELKELGYDRLALDDLVGLRDHGVTPDRIRRANSQAGTKLPLEMIRQLANGGMR